MNHKVLVIGLDCATFKLIKPFALNGNLPNIKKLMDEGVIRILKSTIPPLSPPAWTTFLTGENPGKHGIFNFVDMDIRDYDFTKNSLINSSLYSGRTFIDYISAKDLKVGVIKIPFTYPPWKVNGFMVAGEPSPDWKIAHTYPPELSRKIGKVNLGSSADFMLYNAEALLEHIKYDCEVRTRIALNMIEDKQYDFFMIVHNITDAAAHRFWKYMDPSCPNYNTKYKKYSNLILDVYRMADDSIGKILSKFDKNTTVFLMSDHGAARNPLYQFHIDAWLNQNGYLAYAKKKKYLYYLGFFLSIVKNSLPAKIKNLIINAIKSKFPKRVSNLKNIIANIDWNNTKAYSVTLFTSFDGIVINLKGRQPNGLISSEQEKNEICDALMKKLLELRDSNTQKKIVRHVYKREEVYSGDYTAKMPDLILQYNSDFRHGHNRNAPLVTEVPASEFDFQSGCHDEDGIFVAWGNHIKKGLKLPDAHIQDMAATILYALGFSAPQNMDGRIMTDIFEKAFISDNKAKKLGKVEKKDSAKYRLDKSDENEMKSQLKGLGYL